MNDLISRQAAIDVVAKSKLMTAGAMLDCKRRLESLPPQPVGNSDTLRGKWIDMNGPEVFPFWQRYKCSVCGERADMSNYCPRCGSRMRGEQHE